MEYRYETHMHTREGSACASSTGAEHARAHKEAGYDGIFITDHFFNGNSAVPRELPWRMRCEQFCRGYEGAKEEGDKIGLSVFFGFEYAMFGAEVLVYNLSKEWLMEHEDIDRMNPREAFKIMRADGAFLVQAHPFRERGYIDHIHLYPRDIAGVEAINAAHKGEDRRMNDRAFAYANMYRLPVTSGSDTHHTYELNGGGIITPEPIVTPLDYLRMMQEGKLRLLYAFEEQNGPQETY